MIKHKKITPSLCTWLVTSTLMTSLWMMGTSGAHAAVINGRLYLSDSDTPNYLVGNAPGIKVSVTTNNAKNNGIIYAGNTLKINYDVLDTDLDWVDLVTKQEIEDNIFWYYLIENGLGPDGKMTYIVEGNGAPFKEGGTDYQVQAGDIGKIIGVSIFPKTLTGIPNISGRLEVFDLRDTLVLVPEGQEEQFGGQPAGSVFNAGSTPENNIDEPIIQACPAGEDCGAGLTLPDKLEIVLYHNVDTTGTQYDFQELKNTAQGADKLRTKTWYSVKVFAMEEDPINPGRYLRSNLDVTEQYKDKIVWEMFDAQNPANRQVVNATYNPLRQQLQFKTQKFNDVQSFVFDDSEGGNGATFQPTPAGDVRSTEHQSQQGMKFNITVND